MIKKLNFNKGDLVVRHGKVLKVDQIDKDAVDLQPFFDPQVNSGLTFTIKLGNAHDGHIRRLVSKAELNKLFSSIIKKSLSREDCPALDTEAALAENQLKSAFWIIKTLWLEKQAKSGTLPGGKLSIFQKALSQTTEEIAAIRNTTPEEAKLHLLEELKSSQKSVKVNA